MSIKDLPKLNDALKFEKTKFHEIIREFLKYSHYCGSMFIPEEMSDWCSYLDCDGSVCKNDIISNVGISTLNPSKLISKSCVQNKSLDPILLFNTSCFDDYLCIPAWASKDYHYVVGIFGMIIAVISIFFSLIYMKGFLKEFNQNSNPVLLLISQAACDVFYLIFVGISKISMFLIYSDLVDQLKIYSTFHLYLVNYVLPFASLFEAMSIWILIMASFDRFNYLSHGDHAKKILTRKFCSIFLISLFIFLSAFSLLKVFRYSVVVMNSSKRYHKLVYSSLGQNVIYQDVIRFWIKMPFESLFPLLIIFIFVSIIIHKLVSSGIDSKRIVSYRVFQEYRLTKSLLVIGCVLLSAKIPKMALHILKYEIGITLDAMVKFDILNNFLDMLYYFLKTCVIYRYMCPLYSNWLQNLLCLDSRVKEDEVLRDRLNSGDSDFDNRYSFEKNCRKSLLIVNYSNKETNV